MKSVFIFAALLVISANAQSTRFQNTLSGGLALAVGDGSEGMNPGLNICIEPVGKINKYFGLGGHVDYTWFTIKSKDSDLSGGVHIWDVSFVPKLFIPIAERANFFVDVDPGFCLGFAYASFMGNSDSNVETGFSMTYQAGFDINQFVIGFKMKSAYKNGDSSNWVNFYIGAKL